jgi:hypothetical protein
VADNRGRRRDRRRHNLSLSFSFLFLPLFHFFFFPFIPFFLSLFFSPLLLLPSSAPERCSARATPPAWLPYARLAAPGTGRLLPRVHPHPCARPRTTRACTTRRTARRAARLSHPIYRNINRAIIYAPGSSHAYIQQIIKISQRMSGITLI